MQSTVQTLNGNSLASSRRGFMGRTGTLSAVAVAMLAGKETLAQGMAGDTSKDVAILNVALGLEHEAINAYQLGGAPVMEKTLEEYAKSLQAASLHNQGDVLDLAARLELGAINAYLGVIPAFGNRDLAKVAGRLAADETMHYVLLNNALGRPQPAGALSFGA